MDVDQSCDDRTSQFHSYCTRQVPCFDYVYRPLPPLHPHSGNEMAPRLLSRMCRKAWLPQKTTNACRRAPLAHVLLALTKGVKNVPRILPPRQTLPSPPPQRSWGLAAPLSRPWSGAYSAEEKYLTHAYNPLFSLPLHPLSPLSSRLSISPLLAASLSLSSLLLSSISSLLYLPSLYPIDGAQIHTRRHC